MKPYYSDNAVTLYLGDCLDVLPTLPDASVDAVVTDPPYGLDFMGKHWDTGAVAFSVDLWRDVLRVLKPGGHLLAFGGTRTYHRLACAIEDAGFEIRDSLHWIYGSGFPKSLDVSKAIDKAKANRDEVLTFAAWVREARDAAGISNKDIDDAFGFAGMAGHWTSSKSQPAVPTLEQIPRLLAVLGVDEMPPDIQALALRIIQQKGQPGPNWFKREVVGLHPAPANRIYDMGEGKPLPKSIDITAPATPAAEQWQGWGTALKPAHEPIVLARKPLSGTVAANVQQWGTGALNVDGCRVGTDERTNRGMSSLGVMHDDEWQPGDVVATVTGRWPANILLDPAAAAEMDRQSGETVSRASADVKPLQRQDNEVYGKGLGSITPDNTHNDSGGASRFFPIFRYEAKADASERPRVDGVAHPTVKPVALMAWLVRLVTPPGGVVLEPFAGSGTTAEACITEGFHCIAIEREPDYVRLIEARLSKPIERTLL